MNAPITQDRDEKDFNVALDLLAGAYDLLTAEPAPSRRARGLAAVAYAQAWCAFEEQQSAYFRAWLIGAAAGRLYRAKEVAA